MGARRRRRPGRARPSAAVHLAVVAQHAVKAGLAGEVDALIGQGRDDPCRRHVGKARLIGDGDDARPFGRAQRVRRNAGAPRRAGDRPVPALAGPPALQASGIDAGQGAGRAQPRPFGAGCRRSRQPGSGGLPGGSYVLAVAEDRREFFCQHQQGGRFGQRLVLAVQLALEFLDPAPVLPSFDGTGRPRLAEAGDRVLLPGVQLRRIQALLAAPGAAAWPRPSPPSRSPLPIAPSPSSADCRPPVPWPRRPHANAPASPRSLPPLVRPHQPPNSPAATTARRSGLCTLVRIEPTFLNLRPLGLDPIRAATSLTQGGRPLQSVLNSRRV